MLSEDRKRELLIEEQFPDGKAGSGFSYLFSTDGSPDYTAPDGMVMFEVKMPNETMRLFFHKEHFIAFAHEAMAVANQIANDFDS